MKHGYPPAAQVLPAAVVDVLWKSAGVGLLLVHLLFPAYTSFIGVLADACHLSPRATFCVLLVIAHSGPYVLVNGFFALCDALGWLRSYKIGRKPAMLPSKDLIRRTLTEACINQMVFTPVTAYFLYPLFLNCGMAQLDAPLPPASRIFFSFVTAHLVNEFGFYWTHRLLHNQSLYAPFHKQHHNYKGSIGIAAEYASPVEAVLSNQIPTIGGIFLFGSHPLILVVWLGLRLRQTYEVHSGYCLRGTLLDSLGLCYAEGAAFHDFHHSVNKGNFGNQFTDWLFGTMDAYADMGLMDGYLRRLKQDEVRSTKEG